MVPELVYALLPLVGRSQGVLRAAHMALCIYQLPIPRDQVICHLSQQKMLPYISGISGMDGMIVSRR